MAYHGLFYYEPAHYENSVQVVSEETRRGAIITSGVIVVGVVITLVAVPVSAPVVAALSLLGAVALLVGCAFYSA